MAGRLFLVAFMALLIGTAWGRSPGRSTIIPLRHQNASEMTDLLRRVHSASVMAAATAPRLQPHGTRSGGADVSTTRDVPVDNSIVLGDLRLRLIRIIENRPDDENDDEVLVEARTSGQTQELTIRQHSVAFTGDYEIHVWNVVPSKTRPGKGTARIKVEYAPKR